MRPGRASSMRKAAASTWPGARTKLPRPTSPTTRPRASSRRIAAEAVFRATPWRKASSLCVGSRAPGRSLPSRISASSIAAILFAPIGPPACIVSETILSLPHLPSAGNQAA